MAELHDQGHQRQGHGPDSGLGLGPKAGIGHIPNLNYRKLTVRFGSMFRQPQVLVPLIPVRSIRRIICHEVTTYKAGHLDTGHPF